MGIWPHVPKNKKNEEMENGKALCSVFLSKYEGGREKGRRGRRRGVKKERKATMKKN